MGQHQGFEPRLAARLPPQAQPDIVPWTVGETAVTSVEYTGGKIMNDASMPHFPVCVLPSPYHNMYFRVAVLSSGSASCTPKYKCGFSRAAVC